MLGKLKALIIRKKWQGAKKDYVDPLIMSWVKEGTMGNVWKGLGAAALGGAAGALTDALSNGVPQDLEGMKRMAILVLAGGALAASAYLKGLFTPVPKDDKPKE